MHLNHDPEGKVLPEFRRFASSFIRGFDADRDLIRDLLGAEYRHPSGVFREEILRKFFREFLPSSLSVDTGYVHGFEKCQNSKQIDILIWDSSRFPAIFRAGQFIVVSPESVVAAIEVKSNMKLKDVRDGVSNLSSLIELDFMFRARKKTDEDDVAPPIFKSLVCFSGPAKNNSVLKTLGEECIAEEYLPTPAREPVANALKKINPTNPEKAQTWPIERAYIDLIVSIDPKFGVSFYRGWGPPDDLHCTKQFGPGFRRMPFYYEQKANITSPFEKLVYSVMAAANRYLEVPVSSLLSAWGDFDPIMCMRLGDASEIIEDRSIAAIDPGKFT